jgi:replicative DNA helicase
MARKPNQSPSDRLPPHSAEHERAVLGAVLIDGALINECITKIRAGENAFYDLRHKIIYRTMLELYDDAVPIDTVNLHERLSIWGYLEKVGGDAYVSALPDACATVHNLDSYIATLTSKHLARAAIVLCVETIDRAYAVNGNGVEFITQFEDRCLHVRSDTETAQSFVNIGEQTQRLVQDYEAAQQGTQPAGFFTGFADLDRICGPMAGQEMIVLAGMQSTGKTTLALNIACNVCNAGGSVGLISLETSGKKLVHRLGCYIGEVEGNELLRGRLDANSAGRMSTAFSQLVGFGDRLIISDEGGMDSKSVGALARRMQQRGAQLFIIDYLQLIEAHARSEFERVTKVSRDIKALTKFLNAPVIILSSLNRESTKGKKPRPPVLQDLRMSGQIEYDTDKAWLLYDPKLKQEFDETQNVREVALRIAKHKDGPLGTVNLTFFPKQFRMTNSAWAGADESAQEQEPQQQAGLPYAND